MTEMQLFADAIMGFSLAYEQASAETRRLALGTLMLLIHLTQEGDVSDLANVAREIAHRKKAEAKAKAEQN